MRILFILIISLILTIPEAWAFRWLSNLVMNPYGMHGLAFWTCFGISLAIGTIVLLYRLEHEISEKME